MLKYMRLWEENVDNKGYKFFYFGTNRYNWLGDKAQFKCIFRINISPKGDRVTEILPPEMISHLHVLNEKFILNYYLSGHRMKWFLVTYLANWSQDSVIEQSERAVKTFDY